MYVCVCVYVCRAFVFHYSQDGRIQAGDQLLEVDGKSLIGVSQEK